MTHKPSFKHSIGIGYIIVAPLQWNQRLLTLWTLINFSVCQNVNWSNY